MPDRYSHVSHGIVEVLRRFDFYWIIRSADGSTHQARPDDLRPIAAPIQFPTPSQQPPESEMEPAPSDFESTVLVEINKLSANQLANALPFIGKLKARQILSAKPDGGYAAFGELKGALPDDFLDPDQWEKIKLLISYAS